MSSPAPFPTTLSPQSFLMNFLLNLRWIMDQFEELLGTLWRRFCVPIGILLGILPEDTVPGEGFKNQ